jgi:transposase
VQDGTIIIDLERQHPIALREDRDATTLAAWLQQHPTIRIVAWDRAGVYAEGATNSAPHATHVADRFHLRKNLTDTLLAVFEPHAADLRDATRTTGSGATPSAVGAAAATAVTEDLVRTLPPPMPSPKHQAQAAQRRAARRAAREFHASGWPLRTIGRELGVNRTTVCRSVRATSFPERQPRALREPGVLDPSIPYLRERWNAGCRSRTLLWQEITERGYTGKRGTVFSFVTRLRKALGIPTKKRTIGDGTVVVPEQRPLTPRTAIWPILQRPEKRDEATTQCIATLREAHAERDEAITVTEGFAKLIGARDPVALDT